VLPRSSGILVAVLSGVLFGIAILMGYETGRTSMPLLPMSQPLAPERAAGFAILGACLITGTTWMVRKIRANVDKLYRVTDELTFDLTSQAIDASILVDELVEKNQEIQTLLALLQNIVSVLEWDELFRNVVIGLRNRFKFDKFSLYLYREAEGDLELVVEQGAEKVSAGSKRLKPGDGVVGWAFTQNRSVLIPDVRQDPRYKEFSERGKRIRSLICAPLVFRGETLGVMCLDSEKAGSFDERALNFLTEIAPLISVAVSNSISYVAVKEESHTDNLTGLKNHRGFMDTFLPLLSDSYTDDFALAVMVMDIDNFKKINDTYGHQVGNLILTDLADILKTFFRASDLVARFGGEEFVVVLNGTPAEIAPRIAEQLRRKIESHQFPISLQKDAFKQVTVSIGLATSQDTNLEPIIATGSRSRGEPDVYLKNDAELAEAIIENADQALYVAKREGKNQVRLSFQFPVSVAQPVV
jgi:diguanylate cyclase (GGDEF)-like protein